MQSGYEWGMIEVVSEIATHWQLKKEAIILFYLKIFLRILQIQPTNTNLKDAN